MPRSSRLQSLADAVANRLFEDFLDLDNQGERYTWERGAEMAGRHARDQLRLSYARTPDDMKQKETEIMRLATERFRERMRTHEGELPLRPALSKAAKP